MKCLVIGDVHIKISNVPETDEMIKKLIELATKTSPNFIVLLGDVLDRHATINVHCLMRAETLIHSLSLISPIFVLVGNHDRPNNSIFLTNEHPFNSLKLWPNTYIIDTSVDKIFELNEVKYRFLFVPYVMPGRFDEALQKIENPLDTNILAIFAHQEIHLCKLGSIISQVGDKWDINNPLLISGHIHSFDLLQPNMIYVGSPIQQTFGDDDNKRVSIFMFTKDDKKYEHERIDLGLIKKITIYITSEQIINYEPPLNKLIKLVIKGDEAQIKTIAKLDKIIQLKKQGVKIVFKTIQKGDISQNHDISITRHTYRERLISEIDGEHMGWFNKLFN